MKAYNARGKIMELSKIPRVAVIRTKVHKYIVDNDKVLTNDLTAAFKEYELEQIMSALKWLKQRKFITNKRVNRYFAYSYCDKWVR